jgi:AraC-like DNA-binding protein
VAWTFAQSPTLWLARRRIQAGAEAKTVAQKCTCGRAVCVARSARVPDLRFKQATVSVRVLRGLIHVLEEAGVSRAALLRGEQVGLLQDPDERVPAEAAERLCARALQLSADPALGLHWAEHMSQSTFGPISHLTTAAPSLRHALDVMTQFSSLFTDEPFFQLHEDAEAATIEVLGFERHAPDVQRFASELTVGGFVRMVRAVWAGLRFKRIQFAYAPPSYAAEYRRVYRQPVVFDQARTGLVFERTLLNAPSPYRDDAISATMTPLATQRLAQASGSFAARVREKLAQKVPARVTMDAIAQELGLSTRSLRRRLRDESTTFVTIEGEVLAGFAEQLLQRPESTIKEVASQLGFAGPATFHRAFKRWTGRTPSTSQERRRHGD